MCTSQCFIFLFLLLSMAIFLSCLLAIFLPLEWTCFDFWFVVFAGDYLPLHFIVVAFRCFSMFAAVWMRAHISKVIETQRISLKVNNYKCINFSLDDEINIGTHAENRFDCCRKNVGINLWYENYMESSSFEFIDTGIVLIATIFSS